MVLSLTLTHLAPPGNPGTLDQSIAFDVGRRTSTPSEPLLSQDVGNLDNIPISPPHSPIYFTDVIGNFPDFLNVTQSSGIIEVDFANGESWRGVLSSNPSDSILMEKFSWNSTQHLREDLVALLELGQVLDTSNLIIILPKYIENLTQLIHSFFYVGGSVIDLSKTNWNLKDGYIGVVMQV